MYIGNCGLSVAQLAARLPDATRQIERRKHAHLDSDSVEGCGCCPICHAFIYAEFTQAGELAACPQCGGLIESLDPLGGPPSKQPLVEIDGADF